jgi:hypothetical protein
VNAQVETTEELVVPVVVVVPSLLVAELDALTELYVQKLDGDRVAVRRLVETSMMQHGIKALKEGLDK